MRKHYRFSVLAFAAAMFFSLAAIGQSCSFPEFEVIGSYSFGGGGTPPSCWHQQVFYLEVTPQVSDPDCGILVTWEASTDQVSWTEDCCSGWGHGVSSAEVPTWYRATVNCSCGGSVVLEPYLVVPTFRPYITSSSPIEFGETSLCDGPATLSVVMPDWADGLITPVSYQWYRYNVPVSGATGESIVVSEVGGYTVTMTYLDADGQQCVHEFVHVEGNDQQYTLFTHYNGCGCLTATEVQCGSTVTGNNSSAPDENLGFYPQCDFGANNNAVWYKVTPPASGTVTVSTCGSSFFARVRVYEGPCPGFTSCTFNQTYCSSNGIATFTAVGGQTYHILLTGAFHGEDGDYTLNITCPAACTGEPNGGTAQSSSQTVCGNQAFNLSLTGHSQHSGQTYQWQRSENGTTWFDISGATSATYTATQSSTHHYRCVVTCGSSSNSASVLVTHSGACPANDCTAAIPVTCGTDHIGNSTGQQAADLTGAPFCGSGGSTTRGVWHAYTAPASGDATFSTCNNETVFDTYMRVYDGCAQGSQSGGDMSCMGSNDDAPGCGGGSEVTVTVTEGQTYYVLITGYNAFNFGSYTLESICPAPECDVTISAGGPLQLCPEGSVTLTASPAGASEYMWFLNGVSLGIAGGTGQSITVGFPSSTFTPGTYTVMATFGSCTVTSEPVTVTGLNSPELGVLSDGLTICQGQTTTLTALPVGMTSYQWHLRPSGPLSSEPINGATSQSYTTGQAGTYYVQGTDANGCTGQSPDAVVTVNPSPSVSISGTQTVGSTLTANPSPAGNYTFQWFLNGNPINGATDEDHVTTAAGSYTVQVTAENECTGMSQPHLVDWCVLGVIATVAATANPSMACPGGQVTLSLQQAQIPNAAYEWQVSTDGGDTFTDIPNGDQHTIVISTPPAAAIYRCNIFCGSQEATSHEVTVNVHQASISATEPLCAGLTTLTAVADNADSYHWTLDGISFSSEESISPGGFHTGEFALTVIFGTCEVMAGSVTVHPVLEVMVQPFTAEICLGQTATFTGPTGMAQYSWRHGSFPIGSSPNAQVNELGVAVSPFGIFPTSTYTLTVVDGNGCPGTGEVIVIALPSPQPVIVETLGELSVTEPFVTYQWYHESMGLFGANGPTYTATEDGSYYVEVTDELGCTGFSDVIVIGGCTGNPEGGAAVASQTTLCPMDFFTLSLTGHSSNPGQTYQWQISADVSIWQDIAGAVTPTYSAVFYPDMPYYRCIVTCDEASSESLPVQVGPLFTATLSSDVAGICPGATQALLTALPANAEQYTWFRNGMLIFNPDNQHVTGQATDFVVHVTVDGCTMVSNTLTIESIGAPDATISPASIEICPGQDVTGTLSVPNGGSEDTYVWILDNATINSGAGLNSINVLQTGNYEVEVTNPEGCKSTSQVVPVTFRPLPDASVIPEGVELCDGSVTQISAPPGMASYAWNPTGATTQTITVGTVITVHDVTVTDEHGCTNNSGPVQITVHPNLEVTVSPESIELCPDEEGIFNGPAGMAQYDWQPGGATTQSLTVSLPAETYILTVTDINGCTGSSDPVTVTPANGPEPTVSFNGNVLTTQSGMASYQWYLNGTPIFPGNAATQNPVGDGAYTVTVTDQDGCEGTSEPFMFVGINDVDGKPVITIHPNPASDLLRISGLNGPAMADVMDMAGRTVMTSVTNDRSGIAIGHLASGSYLLRVTGQGGDVVTVRFVRE